MKCNTKYLSPSSSIQLVVTPVDCYVKTSDLLCILYINVCSVRFTGKLKISLCSFFFCLFKLKSVNLSIFHDLQPEVKEDSVQQDNPWRHLPSSNSLTVLDSLSASSWSCFSSSLDFLSSALAPAPMISFSANSRSSRREILTVTFEQLVRIQSQH